MQKLIGIYIPTFNNSKFVIRLVNSISKFRFLCEDNHEIIISDDSTDEKVKREIKKIASENSIRYVKSSIRNGPENWNQAFNYLSTKYVWIIHHDEIFNGNSEELYKALKNNLQKTDLCLVLNSKSSNHNYRNRIACKLINLFPLILLVKNLIGPISCVIIPNKNLRVRFRKDYPLLVDIIFLYELIIIKNFKLRNIDAGFMESLVNRKSITSTLGKSLIQVQTNEHKRLIKEKNILKLKFIFASLIGTFYLSFYKLFFIIRNRN
tara:strand:+ start:18481 stop:19275 length:795 start_codon:yes stop_codon:yes gene_type:complete